MDLPALKPVLPRAVFLLIVAGRGRFFSPPLSCPAFGCYKKGEIRQSGKNIPVGNFGFETVIQNTPIFDQRFDFFRRILKK
jgi:hypothetical protein